MSRTSSLCLLAILPFVASSTPLAARTVAAQTPASTATLAPDDRVRIAEAFRLADAIGDSIWPGWTSAPFALLLVTPDQEFLIRHPQPPADFTRVGYDSLLRSDVLARRRTLAPNLLATFPAAGVVPTIVTGQPGATGKSSTEWVLTLLHEHFHQLQMSRPDYHARVRALALSRGDSSGMWMLNYAFPYDSSLVQSRFGALAAYLDSALSTPAPDVRQSHWVAARLARGALRAALPAADDRYLAFQMWQEGVARFTELEAARFAAARFTPSAAFRALPDFVPFGAAAERIEAGIHAGLRAPLARNRRVAFYAIGAATAMLLDETGREWRGEYLGGEMALDR
jgi:hypothetical protein